MKVDIELNFNTHLFSYNYQEESRLFGAESEYNTGIPVMPWPLA